MVFSLDTTMKRSVPFPERSLRISMYESWARSRAFKNRAAAAKRLDLSV